MLTAIKDRMPLGSIRLWNQISFLTKREYLEESYFLNSSLQLAA